MAWTGVRSAVVLVALLGVWGSGVGERGYGQIQGVIPSQSHGPPTGLDRDAEANHSPYAQEAAAKQERARNDERQKRLVADTDKLLALATQLHEDVSKTNKDVLSVDVIKRAQEIEKLAHDVKERMKG